MSSQDGRYHHGDLRAALLTEAAAMIAEGGAASLTLRGIARRLGVSRAAPYRHFPDKSALLVGVASAGFARLGERLQSIEAGAPRSSVERFRRMGEEYVRFALENPAHYRLMYGKEALTREDIPELHASADALLAQLVDVIKAQQRSGGIKRQDPRTQAYIAWSTVHGLASLLIEGQIQPAGEVDDLIRKTTRTLLDGMRVRRRPAP
ncbi:MAG: TetR/AcrR family transcriptional regulator [Gemmatimonadetes bacterium]|nr:TetR/AcrR family transcriptional regulator [Gemmatimonadota bacterium]